MFVIVCCWPSQCIQENYISHVQLHEKPGIVKNSGIMIICCVVACFHCVVLISGADWPSGAPGEFPVAWQPIWPADLHFFFFIIIIIYYYFFFILLLLMFLLPAECTKVIISEFAIQ